MKLGSAMARAVGVMWQGWGSIQSMHVADRQPRLGHIKQYKRVILQGDNDALIFLDVPP